MPITAIQKAERVKYLGSSDMAAVLGLSAWKTPYDLYLEKTDKLTVLDDNESEAAGIGNMLEETLLQWGAEKLGVEIHLNQNRIHPNGIFAANHDALVPGQPVGLEAKTHGITMFQREHWGDDGTDDVPERVIVQCQHQMLVSDLELVWVPALIGGLGRRLYQVKRDDELCEMLLARGMEFWTRHVLADVPPGDAAPSLEIAKRIRREPGKVTRLDVRMVEEWITAKASCKEAEEKKVISEAVLLAALRDAEAGDCELGRITYFEQTRKAYQVAENTFRVLRLKAEKEKQNGSGNAKSKSSSPAKRRKQGNDDDQGHTAEEQTELPDRPAQASGRGQTDQGGSGGNQQDPAADEMHAAEPALLDDDGGGTGA